MGRFVRNQFGQDVYVPSVSEYGGPTVGFEPTQLPSPSDRESQYEDFLFNEQQNEQLRRQEEYVRQQQKEEQERQLRESQEYGNWDAAMDRWMASVKEYRNRLQQWEQEGGGKDTFVDLHGPEPRHQDSVPERPRIAQPTERVVDPNRAQEQQRIGQEANSRVHKENEKYRQNRSRKDAMLNSPEAREMVRKIQQGLADEEDFKANWVKDKTHAWDVGIEGDAYQELWAQLNQDSITSRMAGSLSGATKDRFDTSIHEENVPAADSRTRDALLAELEVEHNQRQPDKPFDPNSHETYDLLREKIKNRANTNVLRTGNVEDLGRAANVHDNLFADEGRKSPEDLSSMRQGTLNLLKDSISKTRGAGEYQKPFVDEFTRRILQQNDIVIDDPNVRDQLFSEAKVQLEQEEQQATQFIDGLINQARTVAANEKTAADVSIRDGMNLIGFRTTDQVEAPKTLRESRREYQQLEERSKEFLSNPNVSESIKTRVRMALRASGTRLQSSDIESNFELRVQDKVLALKDYWAQREKRTGKKLSHQDKLDDIRKNHSQMELYVDEKTQDFLNKHNHAAALEFIEGYTGETALHYLRFVGSGLQRLATAPLGIGAAAQIPGFETSAIEMSEFFDKADEGYRLHVKQTIGDKRRLRFLGMTPSEAESVVTSVYQSILLGKLGLGVRGIGAGFGFIEAADQYPRALREGLTKGAALSYAFTQGVNEALPAMLFPGTNKWVKHLTNNKGLKNAVAAGLKATAPELKQIVADGAKIFVKDTLTELLTESYTTFTQLLTEGAFIHGDDEKSLWDNITNKGWEYTKPLLGESLKHTLITVLAQSVLLGGASSIQAAITKGPQWLRVKSKLNERELRLVNQMRAAIGQVHQQMAPLVDFIRTSGSVSDRLAEVISRVSPSGAAQLRKLREQGKQISRTAIEKLYGPEIAGRLTKLEQREAFADAILGQKQRAQQEVADNSPVLQESPTKVVEVEDQQTGERNVVTVNVEQGQTAQEAVDEQVRTATGETPVVTAEPDTESLGIRDPESIMEEIKDLENSIINPETTPAERETFEKRKKVLEQALNKRLRDRKKETPEAEAPTEAPAEGPPQYDEDGFDQDGVTKDGGIQPRDPVLAQETITVEEAEERIKELKQFKNEVLRGNLTPAKDFDATQEIATLEKQIAIAKQRQGKTTKAAVKIKIGETKPIVEEKPIGTAIHPEYGKVLIMSRTGRDGSMVEINIPNAEGQPSGNAQTIMANRLSDVKITETTPTEAPAPTEAAEGPIDVSDIDVSTPEQRADESVKMEIADKINAGVVYRGAREGNPQKLYSGKGNFFISSESFAKTYGKTAAWNVTIENPLIVSEQEWMAFQRNPESLNELFEDNQDRALMAEQTGEEYSPIDSVVYVASNKQVAVYIPPSSQTNQPSPKLDKSEKREIPVKSFRLVDLDRITKSQMAELEATGRVEFEGDVIVGKPPSQMKSMWEALVAATTPTEESIEDVMSRELGDAQLQKPERAMEKASMAMQGGVYGVLIEHVGDLTNRMAKLHGPVVIEKLNRALNHLEKEMFGVPRSRGESVLDQHRRQMEANAKDKNRTPAEQNELVDSLLSKYADAHKELPVFNRAQELARDAAVALGEKNPDKALSLLKELKKLLPTENAQLQKFLKQGDINYESTPTEATPAEKQQQKADEAKKELGEAFRDMMGGMQAVSWSNDPNSKRRQKFIEKLANYLYEQAKTTGLKVTELAKKWYNENSKAVKAGEKQNLKKIVTEAATNANNRIKQEPPQEPPVDDRDVINEEDRNGFELAEETWTQLLKRKIQDELGRLKTVQESIEKAVGALPDKLNAYMQAELFIGKAGEQIERFKKSTTEFVKSLANAGITIEQFGDYLYALHVKERNARLKEQRDVDNGSGRADEWAQDIIDNATPEMKKFAEQFRKNVINKRLQLLYRNGLIDKEAYDRLSSGDIYQFYVPLKHSAKPKTGRGFSLIGLDVQRAKGRSTVADNPFIQALVDFEETLVRIEKNKVAKTLLALVLANPNTNLWSVKGQPYKPVFDQDGNLQYMNPDKLKDNQIVVKVGGKTKIITVEDDALVRGFNKLGAGKAIPLLNLVNKVLRASFLKYNPEFFLYSNPARDIQFALTGLAVEQNAAAAAKTAKYLPKALRGIWKNVRGKKGNEWSEWYARYKKAGGKVGWLDYMTIEEKTEKLEAEIRDMQNPSKMKRGLAATSQFFEDINEAVESAARLSAFRALIEAGVSEAKAAQAAKNLTVNFNKKGEWGPAINSLYLFANAGIQGATRTLSLFKSKRGLAFMGGYAGLGFIQSLINRMIGDDEDEDINAYDKIPPHVRDSNWVFMLPGGKVVTIPLPYGLNVPIVLGQLVEERMFGETTTGEAFGRFLGSVDRGFNPLSSGSVPQFLSPTVTDPLVQIAENKTFFGGPIKPEQPPYQPAKPESELYFDSVRPMSQATTQWFNRMTGGSDEVSGFVDISPEILDHMIDSVGGGPIKFITNSVTTVTSPLRGTAPDIRNIPLVRKMVSPPSVQASKTIVYPMFENRGRVIYSDKEIQRYKKHLKEIWKNKEIDNETYKRMRKDMLKGQTSAKKSIK